MQNMFIRSVLHAMEPFLPNQAPCLMLMHRDPELSASSWQGCAEHELQSCTLLCWESPARGKTTGHHSASSNGSLKTLHGFQQYRIKKENLATSSATLMCAMAGAGSVSSISLLSVFSFLFWHLRRDLKSSRHWMVGQVCKPLPQPLLLSFRTMSYRFDGKVCLVTGAASGIGRATAQKMALLGASLALSDINFSGLAETNTLCGGGHLAEIFDVGSSQACEAFVASTITKFGRVDFIFNCAGVNPTASPLTETTDAYWDKLMNTNLRGTYNITRAVMPHLRAGASVVNVSSILGLVGAAGNAIYCATKFGIIGFTKAMALELGPRQVRVNAVAPGYIDTPTNAGVVAGPAAVAEQEAKIPMGRMGTPGEIADVVAFLFRYEMACWLASLQLTSVT